MNSPRPFNYLAPLPDHLKLMTINDAPEVKEMDIAELYAYAADLAIEAPTDDKSSNLLVLVRQRIQQLENSNKEESK